MGAHRAACTNSPANGMLGITISNLSCHDKPSASAKRHAYSDDMPHNPAADFGYSCPISGTFADDPHTVSGHARTDLISISEFTQRDKRTYILSSSHFPKDKPAILAKAQVHAGTQDTYTMYFAVIKHV